MFIARQAIFNKHEEVFGYELLYREFEDSENYAEANSIRSTAIVLGELFESGISIMTDFKKAFL